MVLRATANQKEAISKFDVLTNRNMIEGLKGRATEQWIGNARNSTVTLRVNHAKRKESLLPYPGRSHKPLQQRQAMRQQLVQVSEKSAEVIVPTGIRAVTARITGRWSHKQGRTELVSIRSSQ